MSGASSAAELAEADGCGGGGGGGHERLHVVTAASSPPFHKREIFDRHHATGRIRRRVCASVTHVDRVWTSIAERRSLGVVCEQGHIAVRRAVAVDITHVHSAHLQTKHDPNADNSRVAIVYIPSQSHWLQPVSQPIRQHFKNIKITVHVQYTGWAKKVRQ